MKKFVLNAYPLILAAVLLLALPVLAAAGGHGQARPAKKAILLVTFGTSVPEAQGVFEGIDARVKQAYPGVEVRWAYTAKIIRDKVKKEQGKTWLSPAEALAGLREEGFTHLAVQSLHVIPGAEYHDLLSVVNGFRGMAGGFQRIIMSYPLCSTTGDLRKVAAALLADLPKDRKKGEAVVFMGHGTHHPAGVVYPAMAYLLGLQDSGVFMGTVEGYPELGDIQAALKAGGIKKAYLLPFMTVAGDHAMNDMAGPEDDSWKSVLEKDGVACVPVMKSILENDRVTAVYMEHLAAAMGHFE